MKVVAQRASLKTQGDFFSKKIEFLTSLVCKDFTD